MDRIGLPALVMRLYQEGVALARAEVELAKVRLFARLRAARTGLILLVAALLILLAGLIGLIVGIVLALAALVGGFVAGLIVLAVTLAVAGLLGWLGARLLRGRTIEAEIKP